MWFCDPSVTEYIAGYVMLQSPYATQKAFFSALALWLSETQVPVQPRLPDINMQLSIVSAEAHT